MLWRFVQISDPHLGSETDGEWNNSFICTMMPDVMRCLKNDLQGLAPDFILATGDISSHQSRDAVFAARDLMDSLNVPYYPMGGNHDFVIEESRQWFIEAFHAQVPSKSTYYSFDHKNLHFTVLDPWWKWSDGTLSEVSEQFIAERQEETLEAARWELPQDQLDWLAADLEAHSSQPCIVSCHYPAIGLPERCQRPGLKDAGTLENGEATVALLRKYPQVKAYITGHMHMHVIEPDQGFTHVITGALPEYPVEYRDIQVYEDRLEIHTCALSDPSFSARSLLPGKSYTAGEERDRHAIIPLV